MPPLRFADLDSLARRAGFDLCGVARAEPIPPQHLVSWLEAGMAADMDWLGARLAERLDVRELLPGARSVAALACNYFVDAPAAEGSPIARYARGRDYHYTLKDRLRAFRRFLKELAPEVETYGSVDHGPMMEKVWAARAGLGFIGDNGCLITPTHGSYVLLAALVLDAEVDVYGTGPTPDLCERCGLCVTACPTGALDGTKRVDARLCLSYQTIENPGPVPEHLRATFDNIVFGCDVCQTVCPLNDAAVVSVDERFRPRAVAALDVEALADLSREAYDTLIPGTPLARAKYDGLRRNAVYALGAARRASARPLLEKLSRDASPLIREAAQWALQQLRA